MIYENYMAQTKKEGKVNTEPTLQLHTAYGSITGAVPYSSLFTAVPTFVAAFKS